MKNKIICLFMLVFSVSFFSSAKKTKPCGVTSSSQLLRGNSSEFGSESLDKEDPVEVPELGNIFLFI